jgi:hypothetical protein
VSEIFLILRRIQLDAVTNVHSRSFQIVMNLEIPGQILEKLSSEISRNSVEWQPDGQTHMTKLIVAFR